MVVAPAGAAPVNQIDLKALGPQVFHQAALGEEVVDHHVHRQGRGQDQRDRIALPVYRQAVAFDLNMVFR